MRVALMLSLGLLGAGCRKTAAREPPVEAAVAERGNRVRLPRSAATQVRRLCAVTPAVVGRLAAIEHVDFEREDLGGDATAMRVRLTTKTRPRLGVTVELGTCAGDCPAMSAEAWRARRAQVEAEAVPEGLRGRSDTRVELGVLEDPRFAVSGRPVRTLYVLGATEGGAEHEERPQEGAVADGRRTYLDAYTLYADDGTTRLRVTASYLDDAVGGIDRLLSIAPPEDLEKLATAFASFYLHECQ